MKTITRTLARYGAAALVVAASSVMAELFFRLSGSSHLASIFLLGVLLCAFLLGSGPAYFASGLGFVVYLYLVDPRYKFEFGSAEDFDTLIVFLAVAVLIGLLTGRVRDEAARAEVRARTTGALLAATRDFSAGADEAFIRRQMAFHLAAAARGEAVVRDGLQVVCFPEGALNRELVLGATEAQRTVEREDSLDFAQGGWTYRSLQAGGNALGVAGWRSTHRAPLGAEEQTVLRILADTGAAAIARARLGSAKAEAEAKARTEDLRNALLSSISHDLRTPLSSIMASAGSLRRFGDDFDSQTRRELASAIEQETVRLDTFVANLLQMTRLQAGGVTIKATRFSLAEVIRSTLKRRTEAAEARVTISKPPEAPDALGDPALFELALGNVLDNALRYTPVACPVRISASAADGGLNVEVCDEGGGVPEDDVDRIFQKFYRSPATAHLPGTGLGLSITRGLMEAMGGSVSARNRDDGHSGLSVTLHIPSALA